MFWHCAGIERSDRSSELSTVWSSTLTAVGVGLSLDVNGSTGRTFRAPCLISLARCGVNPGAAQRCTCSARGS